MKKKSDENAAQSEEAVNEETEETAQYSVKPDKRYREEGDLLIPEE